MYKLHYKYIFIWLYGKIVVGTIENWKNWRKNKIYKKNIIYASLEREIFLNIILSIYREKRMRIQINNHVNGYHIIYLLLKIGIWFKRKLPTILVFFLSVYSFNLLVLSFHNFSYCKQAWKFLLENCIAYTRDFWRCLNLISVSFAYNMIDMISICSLCIIMALVILFIYDAMKLW